MHVLSLRALNKSRHAGIPPLNVCMNCHSGVTTTLAAVKLEEQNAQQQNRAPQPVESPELRKLYDALALDETLAPIPGQAPKPIAWKRIHKLPDFVLLRSSRAHRRDGAVPDSAMAPSKRWSACVSSKRSPWGGA